MIDIHQLDGWLQQLYLNHPVWFNLLTVALAATTFLLAVGLTTLFDWLAGKQLFTFSRGGI